MKSPYDTSRIDFPDRTISELRELRAKIREQDHRLEDISKAIVDIRARLANLGVGNLNVGVER